MPDLRRLLDVWPPSGSSLPDPVVERLRATGVFRMALPADLGGLETDPLVQLRAVEQFAEVDASLGWYASIGSDGGYYASFLDPDTAADMFAADPDAITAGFVEPAGTAVAVDDGYTVGGHWPFGSASKHARWLASGCRVRGGDDDGRWIVALLPRAACTVEEDSWQALGLQGSGSYRYHAHDVRIPRTHTFAFDRPQRTSPLYRCPVMYRCNTPGVALGCARGALAEFTALLTNETDSGPAGSRRESALIHNALARAHAQIASARAYAYTTVSDLWTVLMAGDPLGAQERAALRLMIAHVTDVCRSALLDLFRACGGAAVHEQHPLQRRLRDILALGQHALASERTYQLAGAVLAGLASQDIAL
ncbi:acyl-CoA dehydrogenase family protein [Streptomyces huasconensis]|uniref:acyl-CoA dehydrogenase family protein n=1 Tax=Streptomyces huasconensis TaxID=1854574 RepID=UPI0033F05259